MLFFLQVSLGCQMFGIAYTPYRAIDECPTMEEAEEDIAILMKHTRRVRTYTTLCQSVNRVLMRYASEGRLSVLFGVWIDNNDMDYLEIQRLMEVLAEYPHGQLEGIAIGNEVAFRGSMTVYQVAQLVNDVRNQVRNLGWQLSSEVLLNVPIFTIEIIPRPELVEVSDIVAVNIHPFYRYDLGAMPIDPEERAAHILEATVEQIDIYRNLAPGKQLIITEIGWPSDSYDAMDPNYANLDISHFFMQKFTAFAFHAGIEYYYFELFDSLWKKSWFPNAEGSLSEFNWGLYYGDRATPKFVECYSVG